MIRKDSRDAPIGGVPGVYMQLGGEAPVPRQRRSRLHRAGSLGFLAIAVAAGGGLMLSPDDAFADDGPDDLSSPSVPSAPSAPTAPSAASVPSVASAPSVATAPSVASAPSVATAPSVASTPSVASVPSVASTPSVSEVEGVAGLAVQPSDNAMDEQRPDNRAGELGA